MSFGKTIAARGLLRRPLAELFGHGSQPVPQVFAHAPLPQPVPVPQHTDPLDVLTSIKGVVYDWNIVTGDLKWGKNVASVLNLHNIQALDDAGQYNAMVVVDGRPSRQDLIQSGVGIDAGSGVPYQLNYSLASDVRDQIHVVDTGRWFAGTDGKPARAHGVVRVVNIVQAAGEVARSTSRDALTGLYSRDHLLEQAARLFDQSVRNHSTFAILLVSLENLSYVNQIYGYDIADELLAGVAQTLARSLRATDMIARYSGNRFALLLESCDAEQMACAAARFMDVVAGSALATSVGNLPTSLRIGGVIAPRQARGPRAMMQHAEEALDVARERATQRFVAYLPSLVRDAARLRALTIADDVTSALNQRRVRLALQPIVVASTGKIAFHEALMRIEALDGSILQPGKFFPTAEKIGLAQLLDHRVLELAIDLLDKDNTLTLAINCSGATAYDPEWPVLLASMLAGRSHVVGRLIIEVTETCAIADIESTKRVFTEMKALGVRIAMDDFGAGHTSFRNLRDLHVDILKIDGAFVQNLSRSADDRFFVRTLVDLANYIGIATVAEWVEDAESAKILTEWGVTYLQGHHFGVAELVVTLPVAEAMPLLRLSA